MRFFLSLLTLMALAFSSPALALDLHQARAQGLVGERADGYVEGIEPQAGGVASLVTEVNAKRRAEYARIAQEKGQPVDVVAKLAAQQIIGQLPAGAMYRDANGNLKKR